MWWEYTRMMRQGALVRSAGRPDACGGGGGETRLSLFGFPDCGEEGQKLPSLVCACGARGLRGSLELFIVLSCRVKVGNVQ